jgi:hypothetical protein
MGHVKCDHIKWLIKLTSDNIRWLSLHIVTLYTTHSVYLYSEGVIFAQKETNMNFSLFDRGVAFSMQFELADFFDFY